MGEAQVCCHESEKTGTMEVQDTCFSVVFCSISDKNPDSQCENPGFSTD
jgi:hypothetical protein